ncbi:MAG TPA: glycosyltransferase family 4 protein [Pyrinomonadaceae bacterium]|nr:glycosyltransferase family 4 protein [Pyrinomonadaceae bacterium]
MTERPDNRIEATGAATGRRGGAARRADATRTAGSPTTHEPAFALRRRVRVLIVAPSLGILGGQAVQAEGLRRRLGEDSSLEVSFLPINPRLPGLLGKLQGIKYVRTVLTSLAYVALLLWRVRAYDVIHVFSASYFSFVLAPTPAILIAKLYGKRVVLNYHSGEAEDHLQRWRRTAIPTIRLVDAVAVPSGYLVEVFARFRIGALSIYNFVDITRFRFRTRRPLRPVFFSNRNLEPLYNVGCTLRAFQIIQQRFPEATLTVAGDGSQRAELEQLARELDLRGTTFVGRVEQSRMHELYECADIYLNSSDIDNMPVSLIESYAAGLPVVTTDAGGIPHILTHEETGLMVARGDHEALAACAIRLLEDDALAERITSNALAACRRYSWEAVREEWLRLYFELAHEDFRAGAVALPPRVESKTGA